MIRRRLGDVCEYDRTQRVHRGLPYVGMEHIESDTGRFVGSRDPVQVKSNTFHFTSTHVLYGRLRPYLNKVLAPDFDGHCSTEIFPLLPRKELSREFLRYWISSDEVCERINRTCSGARMPRANMEEVLKFEIPLPPLPEQNRIVRILDESCARISSARANFEKNRRNARELFESEREYVFKRQGDGWAEKPLSDLCDIKHGFAFKSEYFTDSGEYVLLTPGNFYEGGGYRDRGEKQKYYVGDIPNGFILSKGNLLVAMTEQAAGLLGSPVLVPESNRFLHNQRLGLVQKKVGVPFLNEFFFHVFNLRHVRQAIHHSGTGVKVRHTSPTKIGEVVVPFPAGSLAAQRAVADQLKALDSESQRLESLYERKLAALDALKKSLLHQAFSGQPSCTRTVESVYSS